MRLKPLCDSAAGYGPDGCWATAATRVRHTTRRHSARSHPQLPPARGTQQLVAGRGRWKTGRGLLGFGRTRPPARTCGPESTMAAYVVPFDPVPSRSSTRNLCCTTTPGSSPCDEGSSLWDVHPSAVVSPLGTARCERTATVVLRSIAPARFPTARAHQRPSASDGSSPQPRRCSAWGTRTRQARCGTRRVSGRR